MLVADISCDVHGSIEVSSRGALVAADHRLRFSNCGSRFLLQFLERTTTVEQPCFEYDPIAECEVESGGGASISVLGVDILPAELPRESSHHFGESLVGVVKELLQAREHRVAETHGIDTTLLSPGLVR